MVRLIKKILLLPKACYNKVYNFLFLKILFPFQCDKFPDINGRIVRSGKGMLKLGENIKINSDTKTNPVGLSHQTMFYIDDGAKITVEDNVGISTSLFYAIESIVVEKNVLIGGGCQFLDNDFHSIDYHDRVHDGDRNVKSAPIIIKEGAFVGTGSIVLKGVTVGARSIIAAGSVIAKSVPPDEIWGGNPAKRIKNMKI